MLFQCQKSFPLLTKEPQDFLKMTVFIPILQRLKDGIMITIILMIVSGNMLNLICQLTMILHSVFLEQMMIFLVFIKKIATVYLAKIAIPVLEGQMSGDQTQWGRGLISVIIRVLIM